MTVTVGDLIAYLETLDPDLPILHERYDPECDVSYFTETIVWTTELVTKLYDDGEVKWDDPENQVWNDDGLVSVSDPIQAVALDGDIF